MRAPMCAAVIVAALSAVVRLQVLSREEQVAPLRDWAQARVAQDRGRYTEPQIADIEARSRVSRFEGVGMLRPDAAPALRELVAAYPASNRAGCVAIGARALTQGPTREVAL